jgi:hypothetical protein
MRRIAACGSVLAMLMLIYLMNPFLAWTALAGTAVFLSLRRVKHVAAEAADR